MNDDRPIGVNCLMGRFPDDAISFAGPPMHVSFPLPVLRPDRLTQHGASAGRGDAMPHAPAPASLRPDTGYIAWCAIRASASSIDTARIGSFASRARRVRSG